VHDVVAVQVVHAFGNVQSDAGSPSSRQKPSSQLQLKMRDINTSKCIHNVHETQQKEMLGSPPAAMTDRNHSKLTCSLLGYTTASMPILLVFKALGLASWRHALSKHASKAVLPVTWCYCHRV